MFARLSLFALLLAFASPLLQAQRPIYRSERIEEKTSRVGFSARMMLGVDMSLSNLGGVSFPTVQSANDRDGRTEFAFSDGFLYVDEGAENAKQFQFLYENAKVVPDPTSFNPDQYAVTDFTLSRYRSESLGATGMAESSSNYGWEITYQYEFGKVENRVRFGLLGGFAINNLDFSFADTVTGRAYVQPFTFYPSRPIVLGGDPGASGGYTNRGDGPYEIDLTDPRNAIDLDAPESVYEEFNEDGVFGPVDSQVSSSLDYDGIMAMFRLGPSVDVRVLYDLHAEFSAGLVGVYLNSRITLEQVLLNLPVPADDPGDAFAEDRSDFLVGYFAEGLLRYQVTPRVGFFGSLMYLKVQDPDDTVIGDVSYDLSLDSPIFATAGMRLVF